MSFDAKPRARGVVPAPGQVFDRPCPLKVVLLGATGSIGRQTVDVVRRNPDKVELVAVAARTSADELVGLAREFPTIRHIALAEESLRATFAADTLPAGCEVSFGREAVDALACLSEADCVLNALVGFSGMRASYNALSCGHELALANKESLVVAGDLIMPLARPGKLLPVDSEHSAIFQCVQGCADRREIKRLILTCSGGPFYGMTYDEVGKMTKADALKHPNWKMGPKITVDCATLMNKGLEVIEAMRLYRLPLEQVSVVIHRQSIVHSLVEYKDGAVLAQLGTPDMRLPIRYALTYPERGVNPAEPLDLLTCPPLTFAEPDREAFPCLRLAEEAATEGGTACAILNGANEEAVRLFLADQIGFHDIPRLVAQARAAVPVVREPSLEDILEADRAARECVLR